MFTTKPNYHKLRTNLKLCINRLKLLEKKKTEQALKARKEIADYIAIGKDDRARIRVEHIIREDYMVEAMEIIEMLCDLILARFGLIEKMTELDPGLETAIATIIWVTPRLSNEILELKEVTMQFVAKYGKEFGEMCRQNGFHNVHEKVIYKMNIASPPKKLIENYMIEIAKTFKISYVPDPFDLQDDIPNTGDLLDLAVDTMPNDFPSNNGPSDQFSNNAKHLEASGYNLGINNDPMHHFNNQLYDNNNAKPQNNFNNDGSMMHGGESSGPPPVPTMPPNSGYKTLTTQITWDNEELPQLPPYESVMKQPFNYPTVPTGNQYPSPNHTNPNVNNFTENPNDLPFNRLNNQPFSNDSSCPYPTYNENNPTHQNTMNSPSNPVPYPRIDRPGGVPVFPKFPDLSGLPSVPTDSLKPASNNDDIDFDDLTRRFEELKKKK